MRVATLRALRPLLVAGAHECLLDLTAFRSPTVVPIKAFFGDDLKVNYFGKLATDSSAAVRAAFLDAVGHWMLHLAERNEHEARLLPYVLSALCDHEATDVQESALGARALAPWLFRAPADSAQASSAPEPRCLQQRVPTSGALLAVRAQP